MMLHAQSIKLRCIGQGMKLRYSCHIRSANVLASKKNDNQVIDPWHGLLKHLQQRGQSASLVCCTVQELLIFPINIELRLNHLS